MSPCPPPILKSQKLSKEPIYPVPRVPIPADFPLVHAHYDPTADVKASYYQAAKRGGNMIAARDFVKASIDKRLIQKLREEFDQFNPIICPVSAIKEKGEVSNLIPQAFASEVAVLTGWRIELNILQINRTKHTGANVIDRLMRQPRFNGKVEPGANYFLVDDLMALGGTLANLYGHIVSGGGNVCYISALALSCHDPSRKRSLQLQQSDTVRSRLLTVPAKASLSDFFESKFGFGLKCLTNAEADVITTHICKLPGDQKTKPIRDLTADEINLLYNKAIGSMVEKTN